MAITAATKLSDFSGFLTPEQAGPIFEKARQVSVVQQLAQKVALGPNGVSVPVVTGHLSAGWVAEGAQKPASSGTMTLKTMSPKKIATIAVVSEEVVRADPGGYVQAIQNDIATAFANAFDAAAFHGTNTPFAAYLDQTSKGAELGAHTGAEGSAYQDLVTALRLLTNDNKELTGWAFDNAAEPTLLGAVDGNGRPIFVDTPPTETASAASNPGSVVRTGRLLGRPTAMSKNVGTTNLMTVVGYAGDWSQVAWGQIGGIQYSLSRESTVTINGSLVSLWENNLVGVRAETELGLLINDVNAFVRLVNLVGS